MFFLLAIDGTLRLCGRGINTYAKHVCWRRRDRGRRLDDPLLSRGEHRSPAKILKETFFLLALFTDEKRGKSHLRGLSSLLKNTLRVHELVARAMRGEYVRHGLMAQVVSFELPSISTIPRVRTYHTKKPSRFVHALSARPL